MRVRPATPVRKLLNSATEGNAKVKELPEERRLPSSPPTSPLRRCRRHHYHYQRNRFCGAPPAVAGPPHARVDPSAVRATRGRRARESGQRGTSGAKRERKKKRAEEKTEARKEHKATKEAHTHRDIQTDRHRLTDRHVCAIRHTYTHISACRTFDAVKLEEDIVKQHADTPTDTHANRQAHKHTRTRHADVVVAWQFAWRTSSYSQSRASLKGRVRHPQTGGARG